MTTERLIDATVMQRRISEIEHLIKNINKDVDDMWIIHQATELLEKQGELSEWRKQLIEELEAKKEELEKEFAAM